MMKSIWFWIVIAVVFVGIPTCVIQAHLHGF